MRLLEGHVGSVHCLTYHPEAPVMASGGADGTIRIWDVLDGTALDVLGGDRRIDDQRYAQLAFSPDGSALAAIRSNWKHWDYRPEGEPSPSCHVSQYVGILDGASRLALERSDPLVFESELALSSPQEAHLLAFDDGGKTLIMRGSSVEDRAHDPPLIWKAPDWSEVEANDWVGFLRSSPAFSEVDLRAIRLSASYTPGQDQLLQWHTLTITPWEDDSALGVRQTSMSLELNDLRTGRCLDSCHFGASATLARFSPDRRRLVLAAGRLVMGFDTAPWPERIRDDEQGILGDPCWRWSSPRGIHAAAFAPDSRRLAVAQADGVVQFLDADDGRPQSTFVWDDHATPVYALAIAPDGMTAAIAGERPEVVLIDLD